MHAQIDTTGDINIVALWLRKDTTRWTAGILGGLMAGAVAMAFAMILSSIGGREFWYPAKLMAAIVSGPEATALGAHFGAILGGFVVFEILCAFFGFVYAHFTVTNHLPALLGMGLVWAAFSWIFIWNLFLHSFKVIFNASLPSVAALAVCLVYGLALTSVSFFDRAMRGGNA